MLASNALVTVTTFVLAIAPPAELSAQTGDARNTMKITIGSGPDRGVHSVEVGLKNQNGESTCRVLPRADREAGHYFNGHFYPEINNAGLMEAVTAFNVGPTGTTNQASFVVSFVSGKGNNMTMRAYEAETRPTRTTTGRVSATFKQSGSSASARVEGETAEGVKVTMEITCNAVTDR